MEFKIICNNNFYQQIGDVFVAGTDYETMYNDENTLTITVVGEIGRASCRERV